ncbi:hypothetical protein J5N97_013772 [Dioscorea zingiberensis]|uniref:Peptidase S8/S53 domain-containing protein n=1 Tax=Dioscorea zingiberensis TaxID=325984 RepID=A0A9D5CRV5_9LILI|nr:hypothetical protein J5N97_013772 [Dioscorea zingiberensis]
MKSSSTGTHYSCQDFCEPRLVQSYCVVMSCFATKLNKAELQNMEALDGFVFAQLDEHCKLGTTYALEFLGLTQFNGLWTKSNEGEGVIIGIADSGILHIHESFKDDGLMPDPPLKWRGCCQYNTKTCDPRLPSKCNNKLIGGRAMGAISTPDDEIGHETHVASTAAGSGVYNASVLIQGGGTTVGIAPKAH